MTSMAEPFRIRRATVRDVPIIHAMLRGLAKYERLLDRFDATRASVRRDGFGSRRYFHASICFDRRTPIGVAVYLFTYSTFRASPILYVEDIFVLPRHRGKGAGQALLAALARIALRKGCVRMDWSVLNWNTPAIRFYERLGAVPRKQWIITTLMGAPLRRLAQDRPTAGTRRGSAAGRPRALRSAAHRA